MRNNFFLLLFFLFAISGFSQSRPPAGVGSARGSSSNSQDQNNEVEEDSIKTPFHYLYYRVKTPNVIITEADTSLNNYFNDIETAKRTKFNNLNTGNNGSSLKTPIFDFKSTSGFNTGFNQYDDYNYTIDSFKFFKTEKTFSDLYFSQILGNQNNFEVGAKFGQKYSGGTRLAINYRRILQVGFYNGQATKTTNFATGISFYAFKSKVKFTTLAFINNNNENHNGGIDFNGLNLSRPVYSLRTNVPTILNEAATRYAYNDFYFITEYALKKTSPDSFSGNFGHIFSYKNGSNKFYDKSIDDANDSIFYKQYNVDKRGIRTLSNLTQISNEFFINGGIKWANGRLSLIYDLFTYTDKESKNINDITAKFVGNINVGKAFILNTETKLGLGANIGSLSAKGFANINLGKSLVLNADGEFFRSTVAQNLNSFFLNTEAVYTHDFISPVGTRLNGAISIPFLKTTISFGQNLISNFIYRDEKAMPKQDSSLLSSTSISLNNHIKLWKFNLETNVFNQTINKEYLALPNQYLKSNFYFESPLFAKVLLLRLGVEYKYIPAFTLPSYDPVSGSYYNKNQIEKTSFQGMDVYLSGKVSKFRIFVKYENLLSLFDNKIHYLTINNPVFDPKIRLGIRWILAD